MQADSDSRPQQQEEEATPTQGDHFSQEEWSFHYRLYRGRCVERANREMMAAMMTDVVQKHHKRKPRRRTMIWFDMVAW